MKGLLLSAGAKRGCCLQGLLKTGNGRTCGWCELVASSAVGRGVVVGPGDSVED